MHRLMRRLFGRCVTLLCCLAAVPASAANLSLHYQLLQGSSVIGRATIQHTGPGHWSGSTSIPGLLSFQDSLAVGRSGRPLRYQLSGQVRGAELAIHLSLRGTSAELQVVQAGSKQRLSLTVPAGLPAFLTDNNVFDGWQILLRHLGSPGHWTARATGLVPQAGATLSLRIEVGGLRDAPAPHAALLARPVTVLIHAAGRVVRLTLWRQRGTHTLLELDQGPLRVVLGSARPVAAAARAQLPLPSCLRQQPVTVASAGAKLFGELTLPLGPGPFPALLLIPGSGPVDLNGNAPGLLDDDIYARLADQLSCHGYAVLRYDKYGLAPSSGSGNDITLGTYVQNVADLVRFLRSDLSIAPHRVALLGHSEGGLIALAAAQSVPVSAVVLLEAPGEPLSQVLLAQTLAQARLRGESPARQRQLASQVQAALGAIRASHGFQLQLSGQLAANPFARLFAPAAGLLRSELAVEPTRLIAGLHLPVLIVQGGEDIQVLPANGSALEGADPAAQLLELPRMGHDLVRAGASPLALPSPGQPLDPALIRGLLAWLRAHLGGA
jgi:alpha-beta hydrolase superfamily lysophospholipase